MDLSVKDASPGKLNEQNGIFFNNNTGNDTIGKRLFVQASIKQAETVAKAIEKVPVTPNTPYDKLVGTSFSDGKDRIDIKAVSDKDYIVKRVENHPFLQDKKSVRQERWNAEDMHAALAADILAPVQRYSYTSKQFPFELPEMELTNKGLIDISRTNNGSLLTFDRPVTRAALGLDSLSPTPETATITQKGNKNGIDPQMKKTADIINAIKADSQRILDIKAQPSNQNTAQPSATSRKDETLSPMLKQFYNLKDKHSDALLLFRCGDFYETYQQDAQKASFILGITLTRSNNIKNRDGKPLEMAGFPHHALDTYLPKLNRAGLRVAICDQLVDPRLAQNKQKTVEQNNDQTIQNPAPSHKPENSINTNPAESHNTDNPKSLQPKTQPAEKEKNNLLGNKDIIDKVNNIIDKNKGVAIFSQTPLTAKTSKGVEFEIDRIVRENSDNLRVFGFDNQKKERSVGIERMTKNQLLQVLEHLSSNKIVFLNAEDNTVAQNKRENKTYNLSEKQKDLIAQIKEIVGDKRGTGLSPDKPVMAVTAAGVEFAVDNVLKDKQGNLLLANIRIPGKEQSIPIELADEQTLSNIVNLLKSSNIRQKGENKNNELFSMPTSDMPTSQPKQPSPQETVEPTQTTKTTSDNKRQDYKLIATEKVHADAKADFPDELVFIRLRNPETKKFMYQTFGEDAERLKNLSPTTAIDNIEIKGIQHRVATLQQNDMDAVRKDMAAQNIAPVFFNAKGSMIENQEGKMTAKQNMTEIKTYDNIQFDVHKNSHKQGIYDIRLYVNGDKVGAHHLSIEDRDAWLKHKVPIRTLMHKYFPELKNVSLENITRYTESQPSPQATVEPTQQTSSPSATDQKDKQQQPSPQVTAETEHSQKAEQPKEQNPAQQTNHPAADEQKVEQKPQETKVNTDTQDVTALTQKERVYNERAAKHLEITERFGQTDKQPIVLLQMAVKDGTDFYQTFNKDAEFVANFLERRMLRSGDNKYISLNNNEINYLKEKLGEQNFVVERFTHNNLKPIQTTDKPVQENKTTADMRQQPEKTAAVDVSPNSRIEYTISPFMRFNKETQQQESVSGMRQLSVNIDGVPVGSKILNKEDRDLLNARPGEITNVINRLFRQEMNGATVNFRQVHKPSVTEDSWKKLTTANGVTFDEMPKMDKLTNTEDGRRYHVLTAKVNGMRLGPKQMYHDDINDFYDRAKPAVEIAAKVFREELRNIGVRHNNQQPEQQDAKKERYDQVLDVVMKAKMENPDKSIIIERAGGLGNTGVYYQMFGEDAKNMAKVANRSLKIMDTNKRVNMEYYSMTPDQKDFVIDKMRKAGFLPVVIDQKGQVIGEGKKDIVIEAMTTSNGRRFEQMSIKETDGRWMLNGIMDGVKMTPREMSRDDAYSYMDGRKSIANILEKYCERTPEVNTQKDDLTQQPKMRR